MSDNGITDKDISDAGNELGKSIFKHLMSIQYNNFDYDQTAQILYIATLKAVNLIWKEKRSVTNNETKS